MDEDSEKPACVADVHRGRSFGCLARRTHPAKSLTFLASQMDPYKQPGPDIPWKRLDRTEETKQIAVAYLVARHTVCDGVRNSGSTFLPLAQEHLVFQEVAKERWVPSRYSPLQEQVVLKDLPRPSSRSFHRS